MLSWIEASLTSEQQQPFARKTPNANILAAAGSGKTRTLTHLLIQDLADGIRADRIVAFTFTEKAAHELLARIHGLASRHLPDVNLTGMFIGTIHSWCLRYLTNQSQFYGTTPIDELHLDAFVSRLYDFLGLDQAYGKRFPHAISDFIADLEVFYNEHLEIADVPEQIRPALNAFVEVLHKAQLLTFGGMIRHTIEHLEERGPDEMISRLYVDEYQDVNPAQVRLIKAMVPQDALLVTVGDDLQCIYNWRGSDVTRILRVQQEFKGVSVFRLAANYRSRPPIVRLGNRVADRIVIRDAAKVMNPQRLELGVPALVHFTEVDEISQAAAVADVVQRFIANGVPADKIAILLRSVMSAGRLFVDELEERGVPVNCAILSRGGGFIEGFLLPLFDWLRREHAEPRNSDDETEAEAQLAIFLGAVEPWLNGEDVEGFLDAVNEWLARITLMSSSVYNVRSELYDLLYRCRIGVSPDDHNVLLGLGIASQIIRSVEEVHRRRLEGHQRKGPRSVYSEVYFALLRQKDRFGESVPVQPTLPGVVVTTVHQAKGLEWPVVILPMLVKNRFPLRQSGHGTSFPDAIAGRYGTKTEDERRLFLRGRYPCARTTNSV